jgi:hypothetical protein
VSVEPEADRPPRLICITDDEEGSLPGPVYTGVHASYDNSVHTRNSSSGSSLRIWAIRGRSGQMVAAEVFMCPGFRRGPRRDFRHIVELNVISSAETLTSPPVSLGIPEPPSLYQRPMKLAELEKYGIPAECLFLTDLDLVNVSTPPSGWGPIDLPPVPCSRVGAEYAFLRLACPDDSSVVRFEARLRSSILRLLDRNPTNPSTGDRTTFLRLLTIWDFHDRLAEQVNFASREGSAPGFRITGQFGKLTYDGRIEGACGRGIDF